MRYTVSWYLPYRVRRPPSDFGSRMQSLICLGSNWSYTPLRQIRGSMYQSPPYSANKGKGFQCVL